MKIEILSVHAMKIVGTNAKIIISLIYREY